MNEDNALTPFRIAIPQADIDDLRDRLAHTRWPVPVPGRDDRTDFSRGIPLVYLKELAEYWRDGFDWRAQEEGLNEYGQFTTAVDGQTFHVVHVRSTNPEAVPLILNHGWPGSFVEYQRLIPLLTDEFHVVVPSLPGFGFSTPLSGTGWELARTTEAYAEIMTRLGYERFAAHGTDIGAGTTGRLAALHPERVIGTHIGSDPRWLGLLGDKFPYPDGLSDDETAQIEAVRAEAAAERGYLAMQDHRPDTIGAALTDSPVGQLAWIAEKFKTRADGAYRTPDETVDRDQLLTNISLYWFTRSGASSAQFYYESAHSGIDLVTASDVPSGWAVFDTHPLMRRAVDPWKAIGHWSEFTEGGHFPAMEATELLADDIRAFFHGVS
ncbi:epoxide hydrolase family protein [Nocardiopsis dassonvillei]|uniref:Microsomal epoxide hydrolase n=1 Tax=Nocardiopsis dassonvillei (strain ATCC 23218 / DSM 43111 / CIP 107115 / JCM 7437 / KCTC 9190 / NBRC 14626 / NCTC 10488 / NRRL B-5397 / IMRU 509) TaxID=446468 RepID=D7AYU4_NOCDD|nr:epoxide hydrolase family protein [Nocardiopsis dassonvillei]ADH68106.1 Microsomal epoxide hydrolase [Nocardiopsis dassonvillei subsp. dassonvillei DSM 43111]NKY77249.1 epoxide hydrolase 1 [Nocardiopsis dassonvillei]VEI88606.1 Soluble epoxide hydrolase [Nocardiopsis dassonvillei]